MQCKNCGDTRRQDCEPLNHSLFIPIWHVHNDVERGHTVYTHFTESLVPAQTSDEVCEMLKNCMNTERLETLFELYTEMTAEWECVVMRGDAWRVIRGIITVID